MENIFFLTSSSLQIFMRGCLDIVQEELSQELEPLIFAFCICSLLLCLFYAVNLILSCSLANALKAAQKDQRRQNLRRLKEASKESEQLWKVSWLFERSYDNLLTEFWAENKQNSFRFAANSIISRLSPRIRKAVKKIRKMRPPEPITSDPMSSENLAKDCNDYVERVIYVRTRRVG